MNISRLIAQAGALPRVRKLISPYLEESPSLLLLSDGYSEPCSPSALASDRIGLLDIHLPMKTSPRILHNRHAFIADVQVNVKRQNI